MGTLAIVLSAAAFGLGMSAIFLALYLDLRIDALKRSGDLPGKTPQLFGGMGQIDLGHLYSRRFREIDAHTRRLVPFIRIALPLAAALMLGSVAWNALNP